MVLCCADSECWMGVPHIPTLRTKVSDIPTSKLMAADRGRSPADLYNKLTELLSSKEELGQSNCTPTKTDGIKLLDQECLNGIRR